MGTHRWLRAAPLLALFALLAAALPLGSPPALANHTPTPTAVTIAGSFQSEVGCPGDWQPTCATTHLAFDADDAVWQGTWTLPASNYEYKAALNDAWDENYGLNAARGGANIPLNLTATTAVKFYYDHTTHWVTSNRNSAIATVAGSFQSELGCPGDWSPDCLRSWMQDPDGDGTYTFSTTALPIDNYEFKVAIGESWNESYPSSNVPFSVTEAGQKITINWNAQTKQITLGDVAGNLGTARAHWVTRDTIAWNLPDTAANLTLYYDPDGGLALDPTGVSGGESFALSPVAGGLPDAVKEKFPHLAAYKAWQLPADALARVAELLKGQVVVVAKSAGGTLIDATALQLPGVLDDLYTYDGPLGVGFSDATPTLRLWAPTAKSVTLQLYADADAATPGTAYPMTLDPATGVWSVAGQPGWNGQYYRFDVEVYVRKTDAVEHNLVTDPYSLNLATNSTRSQIVDLDAPDLKPAGWDSVAKPPLAAPEDIVLYELHIRDFSANDPSAPEAERGTYAAFTRTSSNGMQHLQALARAGMTHIHLLPAFDCATINENKAEWQAPDPALLATYPPDGEQQAAAVKLTADQDGFNWCYDPYHYTVPEGSYATDPSGTTRIREFREMVQALNASGLRVVMDVVYNHTSASGQSDKSVLDKIVPGYYHRLNADGDVEKSTCCENTATEHNMMEKLMIDSVQTWATEYKVDGFRFDLMGHHMKRNMLKLRATLDALTPANSGVDGSKIYVYGEGWNFGEVADNARGVNATQLNMGGTGIGTFNDRIRDAVRGGGPFDSGADLKKQGFGNGLYTDPNDLDQGTPEQQKARLLLSEDQIRVGLAGNLRDYQFEDRTGATVTGKDVDYNGSPTGYALDPQETINYVEAHDNQTLFDVIQAKAPADATMEERVRMQNMGNSVVALAQGIPFFQAGQDMLRSKSESRNSYNAGDWFNRLDWSYAENNWGVGLPPDVEDEASKAVIRPLLANPALKPSASDIERAVESFRELLEIRKSSKLFRLETAADVQQRVSFLNTGTDQVPGVIVMRLSDLVGPNLDPKYAQIVVVFNASDEEQTITDTALAGARLRLHSVQLRGSDPVVKQSRFNPATGALTVPAMSTAVFVTPEQVTIRLPYVFVR